MARKNTVKNPENVVNGIKSGITRKTTDEEISVTVLLVGQTGQHEFEKEEFLDMNTSEILEMFPDDENLSYMILEEGAETSSKGWIRRFQEVDDVPQLPIVQQSPLNLKDLGDLLTQQRLQSEAMMNTMLKQKENGGHSIELMQKLLSDKDAVIGRLERKIDKQENYIRETERYYNDLITKLRDELQLSKMQAVVNENAKSNYEKSEDLNKQLRNTLTETQERLKDYELRQKYKNAGNEPDPVTAALMEKGMALADRFLDSVPSAPAQPAAINLMKEPKG